MTQQERRIYLIHELLKERPEYADVKIPENADGQKRLLRSLLNLRMPMPVTETFLKIQDQYLQTEIKSKGVTRLCNLTPVREDLYLRMGDITTLACDAAVNAANSKMLGCFYPCHGCIDNAIHTFSGVQLRSECERIMRAQGCDEKTGYAKITPAYNLPCRYILHTVGPVVSGAVTEKDRQLLASCYLSCMELGEKHGIQSIAFCCISTGEFHFPGDTAAQIAIETVKDYKSQTHSKMKVIFNVFKQSDLEIYRKLLG